MSEQLRRHPDVLAALVAAAASALGLPMPHVEKDFWITEVLRVATSGRSVTMPDGSSALVVFIFKGGTSLSRVFGIIDRFSEDVDLLAVFPGGASLGARHAVLKQIDRDVTAHLGLSPGEVTVGASTTGIKRYTTYHYPADGYGEGLREGVLLELGSRGGTYPAGLHRYRSLVADHAIANLRETEDVWEEFASFEVDVLAPERTLLEKIAAVHDAAVRNDTERLLKQGRHFYDIERLLGTRSVRDALAGLGPTGYAALVEDINVHSEQAGFSWSPRPEGGYAASPAFNPSHPSHAAIVAGYKSAMHLVHGKPVDFDDVLAAMSAHGTGL